MKNCRKNVIKSRNGITLIALVITIIVLLILAGISISMLSGDNSILQKATDAKTQTGIGQEKETISLAYNSALTKKVSNADLTAVNASDMNTEFQNEGTKATATDGTNSIEISFFDSGNSYIVDSNGIINPSTPKDPSAKLKIADKKTTSGQAVTALSDNEVTILDDDLGNEVKVPKGFGIAEDSGTKVEEGIVIEDSDSSRGMYGSQFVWVPVGTGIKVSMEVSASGTVDIPLGRYVFNTSTGAVDETLSKIQPSDQLKTSESSSYYFTEGLADATTTNTHAKDIEGFISSANSNGGYYIARYEAGIKGTTNSTTSSKLADGITSKNSNSAAQIVTKPGVGVWNYINQKNAASICQNMYSTSDDKIISDLINSYTWDTAIVFIQKCGNNGEDSRKYSKQYGYSETGNITTTGSSKLKYVVNSSSIIRTTKILDSQCKIFDMAGNVWEWTTETCSISGNSGVHRGGVYGNPMAPSSFRDYYSPTSTSELFGFRPILYF